MKSILASIALFVASTALCHATYLTYSEWEALAADQRAIYIAGALDALISYAPNGDTKYATHIRQCIVRTKMNDSQLAENVRTFASARSQLQSVQTPISLMSYLIELCGKPPQ
jgi:hypothetical protein